MKKKLIKKTKGILMLELLILIVCFVFPIAIAVSCLGYTIAWKFYQVKCTVERLYVPKYICVGCGVRGMDVEVSQERGRISFCKRSGGHHQGGGGNNGPTADYGKYF